MNLDNTFKSAIAAFLFGNVSYTPAASYYLSAHTGVPTALNEISNAGYARTGKANNTVTFIAGPSAGIRKNGVLWSFPEATEAWDTITHIALHSASSGWSNVIGWMALPSNITCANGNVVEFAIGTLTFTVSGNIVDGLKTAIAELVFGGTPFSPPATYYESLHTASPAAINELSQTGYARVAIVNNGTNFVAGDSAGIRKNGVVVTFPDAGIDWPAATHAALHDASSGWSNLIAWTTLSPGGTALQGSLVEHIVGGLTFSFS